MQELPRAVREARLIAANPDQVFRELEARACAAGSIFRSPEFDPSPEFEKILLSRREPLIDLSLAHFARDHEVLRCLYVQSLSPAADKSDQLFKLGLRVACLANRSVRRWRNFPCGVIGADEVTRVIQRGADEEREALIQNPAIEDDLLEGLYLNVPPFDTLDDKERMHFVHWSVKNPRLIEPEDDVSQGNYGLHKAIFQMLQTAPRKDNWLYGLYRLLDHLTPGEVARPDSIDAVLDYWSWAEEVKRIEGQFTRLPLVEEFRCYIAALYGVGHANGKTVIHGDPSSSDIARRCAFFANGRMTVEQIEDFADRDCDTFVFAALLNEWVMTSLKRRTVLRTWADRHTFNSNLFQRRVEQARVRFRRSFEEDVTRE